VRSLARRGHEYEAVHLARIEVLRDPAFVPGIHVDDHELVSHLVHADGDAAHDLQAEGIAYPVPVSAIGVVHEADHLARARGEVSRLGTALEAVALGDGDDLVLGRLVHQRAVVQGSGDGGL
jgi:hypothetical protein